MVSFPDPPPASFFEGEGGGSGNETRVRIVVCRLPH